MRALSATGQIRYLRSSTLFCTSFLIAASTFAQQIQFGFEPPAQAELTPPRVDRLSGPAAARLEQARALMADRNWQEAVDVYRKLIAEDVDRVIALDDGRYVSLRTYCHLQLASLPPEALAEYRRQVDPLAEQWYRDGIAYRDAPLLRRLVAEFFCSTWGDDALLALGEMALERAEYATARRYWLQISPLLRSPAGLPLWLALRDIDLASHWPEVERRWLDRPRTPDWLAYPDTQLNLSDVCARLVLVSIRAGQRDRATLELNAFRLMHPNAVGRLGGQVGPYFPALERLLTSADDPLPDAPDQNWLTFASSPSRSGLAPPLGQIAGPAWPRPIAFAQEPRMKSAPSVARFFLGGDGIENEPKTSVRESQQPLSSFPIVIDRTVVFADAAGVHAVDLASGKPTVTPDGLLYRNEPRDSPAFEIRLGAGPAIARGVARYSLTAIDRVVYGRVGRLVTTQFDSRDSSPAGRLIGLDLARDGLLTFSESPKDADWSFDGAPVSDGHRLYVAMRKSDVTPHAYVACFDSASGTPQWRTSIGSADTPAAGREEITHNLLTLVDDRIYFNTNLGLVAALDTDGRICWLRRYERTSRDSGRELHFDRDPVPCLFHDGLLVVAPSDTPAIFALDADTGKSIWTAGKFPDALHLLAAKRQNLVISGNRLSILDVRTGNIRVIWPESEQAGIRGLGRGVVAGDEIFWPTRHDIYVFSIITGQQSRTPISLDSLSDSGANLVAANGYLIVCGPDKLMALGASSTPAPKP